MVQVQFSIAVVNVKFSHKGAYFNSSDDNKYVKDNMYVGFKYTNGEVHGLEIKSNALEQLENWYINNLVSYGDKIDINAGFCGDRTPSTSQTEINNQGGTGTITTYYGAYIRLITNKAPSLKDCPNDDLYTTSGSSKGNESLTYPIGLISADEVALAGGAYGQTNYGYYLYTDQLYWTMSPFYFYTTSAYLFAVNSAGSISGSLVHNQFVNCTLGIRPVINLKNDVILSGSGTVSDPYVVE